MLCYKLRPVIPVSISWWLQSGCLQCVCWENNFKAVRVHIERHLTMGSDPDSLPSSALGSGTASSDDAFWLENIKHQGISAFNATPSSYQVFRNVKYFGARGDGTTDDTHAIKCIIFFSRIKYYLTLCHSLAISSGGRCGGGTCGSSTFVSALV